MKNISVYWPTSMNLDLLIVAALILEVSLSF
jgi:hypothetical protein